MNNRFHFLLYICFISYCFMSCNIDKNKNNSKDKNSKNTQQKGKDKVISYYIEAIDKANNSLSRKILAGVKKKLTSHDFVMDEGGIVIKINQNEKIDLASINAENQEIHKFFDIQKLNNSNIPNSNSVKVRITFNPKTQDENADIYITFFCKQGRPEWWQCSNAGQFNFPSKTDIENGKIHYTTDELIDTISDLILKLTYKR
ncbi:MAG: hypothetical protein EAZ55_12235 [Cytophagales bacterium]|nr:MAG: hypothetical protein EAZ55_12235 [Cytophagales bacterium]